MLLLEALNIEKNIADRLLFHIPELRIYSGDRIGVVGANGAGKTTLMDILSGASAPEEGLCKRYCDIAYIRQFSEESAEANDKEIKKFRLNGKTDHPNLSGGEQTRVKIANALSRDAMLIFADEPTSNLDMNGIELLQERLDNTESLVIISHDRALLDALCTKIWEIRDGMLKQYDGNYSFYLEQAAAEFDRASFEYEQYRQEKSRLEKAYAQKKSKAASITKKPKGMSDSDYKVRRFTASKAYDVKQKGVERSAKAMQSRLDQMEIKERPKEIPRIRVDFNLTNPPRNKILLSSRSFSFSYGSTEIFDQASFELMNGSKTAIIGENGAGKTTLLRQITAGARDVYCVPQVKLGYLRQNFEDLEFDKTVLENVMQSSVQNQAVSRSVLAQLLFQGDDVHKKAGVLSGGEKVKLSLAKLFTSDVNVLLLDEPTNYLDLPSLESVQSLLCDYEGTVLFVSHDKAFVNAVADRLWQLRDRKILSFDGNLDAWEAAQAVLHRAADRSTDKMVLELRRDQLVSQMSLPSGDKNALEAEYKKVLEQLKQMQE